MEDLLKKYRQRTPKSDLIGNGWLGWSRTFNRRWMCKFTEEMKETLLPNIMIF
jgi:hypothetical protein